MSQQFLLITLIAPMASFGELAGHERRGSRARPARSALLGLLGAALGIRREDKEKQDALRNGIDTAVRVEQSGIVLQDFHTVQSVSTNKKIRPQTRAEALTMPGLTVNTSLTRRDYRMDVHFIAAYSLKGVESFWTLSNMKTAFQKPRFVLSLGRKSCPLSAPLDPRIVTATDMLAALSRGFEASSPKRATFIQKTLKTRFSPRPEGVVAISADILKQIDQNQTKNGLMEQVHDEPLDRQHWYFASRQEVVFHVNKKNGEEAG